MSSINKNSVFLSVSSGLASLTNLTLSVVLARIFLDKNVYGQFFQIFIIVNLALSLTSGIPIALTYFYGKYKYFTERFFLVRKNFYLTILIGLLIGLLFFNISEALSLIFGNGLLVELKRSIFLFIVFKLIFGFFANFSLINDSLKYYFRVVLFGLVATLILMWLSVSNFYGPKEVLMGLLLIEGMKLFLCLKLIIPSLKLKATNNILPLKTELNYIFAVTGVGIVNTANILLDKYMISGMLSADKFADYQVASFTIPFISMLAGAIVTSMIPEFSNLYSLGRHSELLAKWRLATKEITLILLPIFLYCIFNGKFIIEFFYGSGYAYSGELFQIYSIRFLGSVVLFSLTMSAFGLQNYVLINSLLSLLFNLLLNYILIALYGLEGAIAATIISTYLGYIYCIYILKKKSGYGFTGYFPFFFYLKVGGICALLSIINFFVLKSIPYLGMVIVLAPIYYFLAIYIIYMVTGEKLGFISKLFKKISGNYV